jgi:hypothetical protein
MNISAYRADYLPYAGTIISGMILNLLSDAKIRLFWVRSPKTPESFRKF